MRGTAIRLSWHAIAMLSLVLLVPQGANAAPSKMVIYPFELINDSMEGEVNGVRADETKRLALVTEALRKAIADDGRYELVDIAPIAKDVEVKSPMHKCNGCEDDLAKKVGAKLAIIATVQKVSNLILNLNVYIRDVEAQKIVQTTSTDIRSNDDVSWIKALNHLIKNKLLIEGAVH